jgi:hypothetical protein
MAKAKTVAGTADDPTVRFTKITLGERTLSLAFDFNAIALAESLTGQNLLQGLTLTGITAGQLRGLFYACCLKAQPKITLEEVTALMTLPNLAKIAAAIERTWEASLPDPDPNVETPQPAQAE